MQSDAEYEESIMMSDGLIATRVVECERSSKRTKFHTARQNLAFCPHCSKLLTEYKRHENLYRKGDGSWITIQSWPSPEQTETEPESLEGS